MPSRLIYALGVPGGAQIEDREQRASQIAVDGTLGPGTPAVERIAPDAEERTLRFRVAGKYADVMGQEFRELFSASAIEEVPVTITGEGVAVEDGYYTLSSRNAQASVPRNQRSQEVVGQLRRVGSKRSHWRALDLTVTNEDNPFGDATVAEVGVPERARKVRWFDRTDGTLETAESVRTVDGEHDGIDIYDAENTSLTDPTLIYRVDYRHEWPVDVKVWDDRDSTRREIQNNSEQTQVGSATVGTATVSPSPVSAIAWQRVFVTDHEYVGRPVVETDRVQVVFDEERRRLMVSSWTPERAAYERVQLGDSTWRLFDVDISRIGAERVEAQVEFRDRASDSTHNLDMSLKRGWDWPLWTNPDNEGSVPTELVDRLDAVAADAGRDASAVQGLVTREETDR